MNDFSWRSWLKSMTAHVFGARNPRGKRKADLHFYCPRLEGLEERLTPATATWDGGAGTALWSDAANWSGDTLPVNGDTVEFDGGVTSTFDMTGLILGEIH